jgi:hypothetical protein
MSSRSRLLADARRWLAEPRSPADGAYQASDLLAELDRLTELTRTLSERIASERTVSIEELAAPLDLSDDNMVGEGESYAPLLAAARALLPLLAPWENPQPWWGLGSLGGVEPDGDLHRLSVLCYDWEQRGLGRSHHFELASLRADAISLLVYCAAQDARTAKAAVATSNPTA